MEKYLIFKTAAADSICLPARELSHMHIDGAGTALDFNFINSATGDDGLGEFNIPVVINDNKGREVMKAVADEIRTGGQTLIVVVDDIAAEFLHSDITSCGAIPTTVA
tara:strand:- start:332 stop:655 length:324 start_codon:yes stop_codon:yes gene_type:complete